MSKSRILVLLAAALGLLWPSTSAQALRGTSVQGWSTATASLTAGSTFRDAVTVLSGTRKIRRSVVFQHRSVGETNWVSHTSRRTRLTGRITMTWTMPASGSWEVRFRVLKTTTYAAFTTPSRRLDVLTASSPGGDFAAEVFRLTNVARAQARSCGSTKYPAAAALTRNAKLDQAAAGHAGDMAVQGYFSHTSADGRSFVDRINATGYQWSRLGENIAAGQTTPQQVVDAWIASPGHCANLMNARFTEIGVGYAFINANYRHYWVQDFGTP